MCRRPHVEHGGRRGVRRHVPVPGGDEPDRVALVVAPRFEGGQPRDRGHRGERDRVELDPRHRGDVVLGDRLEPLDHPARSVRRVEVVPDQVRVAVVVDPVVRRDQVSVRRVDRPRQLVERDRIRSTRTRRSTRAPARCRRPPRAAGTVPSTDSRSCRRRRRRRSSVPGTPRPTPRGGTPRSWSRARRPGRATDGCRSRTPSTGARTSRPIQRDVLGVHVAHRGRLDDRAVSRLVDVDDDGFGGSADVDLFAMDGQRLPDAVVLGGGAARRSGARRRGPGRRRSRS